MRTSIRDVYMMVYDIVYKVHVKVYGRVFSYKIIQYYNKCH